MSGAPADLFVGRSKELARLQDALGRAIAGEGRMVMLAGEPGIGKTRTAEELTRTARERGVRVLWGGCYEGEGAPLYWPWTQILRDLAAGHPPKELADLLGPRASVIAATFPLLAEILPDLPPPPPLDDPISARFRLFDAFSAFLKDSSRGAPLLIVLDDLHWADESSLLLLEFLAHQIRSARLLVLGTYRDVEVGRMHPLQRTLGDLTRQRLFERVTLRGLGVEEVRQYLEGTAGAAMREGLAEEVHERTEGNPLFVTEVVRLLGDEGELEGGTSAGPMVRVPEGIRETIGRRMDRLPARCSEALRAAALLGRRFRLATLARVIEGRDPEALLEAVGSAVEARLVEESPGEEGWYRFTHALTQQTLAEEVPLAKQVRLHAKIVSALEEQYGEQGRWEHAEELAEHCEKAETVLGTARLASYLLAAGQAALVRYANEEAKEYFRRALEAKGTGPVDEERADILYGLGRAQLALQEEEGVESLAKAFDYYADAGFKDKAVAVAVDPMFRVPESRIELLAGICRRAMGFVDSGTVAEAEVLAKLALSTYRVDADYAAACTRLERSLEIARRAGAAPTEMRAWVSWVFVESSEFRFPDALEKAEKAYRIAESIDDLHAQVVVLWYRLHTRRLGGMSLVEREPDADRLVQLAERLNDRWWLAQSYFHKEVLALEGGRWDEALRLQDVVLGYKSHLSCVIMSHRAIVHFARGNLEEGERWLRRAVACVQSRLPERGSQAAAAGWIAGAAFEHGMSWPDLLETAEQWSKDVLRDTSAPRSASIVAEFATWYLTLVRGDGEAAAGYCARAEEILGGGRWPSPDSLILLPLLERAAGRIDAAIGHFRYAIEESRRQGRPSRESRYGRYLGETLLETGRRADVDEAIRVLQRSLELAQRYGLALIEKDARAALDAAEKAAARGGPARTGARSEAGAPARPALPDGLTEREVDVLRLLAKGRTNKEIGFELFISPKTVDTHVQSILRKTGAVNRAEAVAYAMRKGLAEG